MKITVFGSTGMTGLCAVEAALNQGHTVRAFVRDPSKVPDSFVDLVEIITGNILNYNEVLNAIKGVDGVTVALGTRNNLNPTTDLSEGLKNIVNAMKEANVEILSVCLSSFLFWDPEKVPSIFNNINEEHKRMLDIVKNSSLKYIACLPPHIADHLIMEYETEIGASPGRVVTKYALGKFLIDCLSDSSFFGQVVGIHTKQ